MFAQPTFSRWLLLFVVCGSICSAARAEVAPRQTAEAVGFSPNSCGDSVEVSITPVSCHGLRDGSIRVTLVEGGAPPYHYSIDNQNFTTNPLFERLWAGDYTLWVRDDSGCVWSKNVVLPEPQLLEVKLNVGKTKVKSGEVFQIDVDVLPLGQEVVKITWRAPDVLLLQDVFDQKVSIENTTTFAVEIANSSGCIARDQATVEVERTDIFFPNIFKPGSNQDSYFTAYAGEGVKTVRSLAVYNRWGVKVFENIGFPPSDPFQGWNGRFEGKLAQSGIYLWVAEVEMLDGSLRQLRGDVTLVSDVK